MAPVDSGDFTAPWWDDSEVAQPFGKSQWVLFGSNRIPKRVQMQLRTCQHVANCDVVPLNHMVGNCMVLTWKDDSWWILLLGKEKWKATTARTPHAAVGDGKEMFLLCKLVRYCNTKAVLVWTRNLEAPELKAETSTHRPRSWDLGVCLVWRTYWN